MAYGYAEYSAIKGLLDKYNIVLKGKDYENFMRDLVDILKL
jgi:hypothetical protein